MTEQQEAPDTVGAVWGPENQLGGGSDAMVPQGTDHAHPDDALFPESPRKVFARPVLVVTAGRVEYAARCPRCDRWHRHVSLGEKTAPCGQRYELAPKRGRAAA